jgi:D-alanyl-D-alanine carboxypeptidase
MTPRNQSPPNPPALSEELRAGNPPRTALRHLLCLAVALLAVCAGRMDPAIAGPALLIEMPSGAILYEDHATQPWYPASVTKLMTVFVALSAVRDHRITLDTPLAVSARAASAPPSKMGFRPGTLVTLDNALKMLMVKSANDMAVVIAEGVSGSVEAFAEDMNETARSLGLSQSHFVNPNGLPSPQHVSSARDLAILARALYLTFPEQASLFHIGAMRLGDDIIHNHNDLLGRYPGVDGMKTGFTCAAGFNIVASASQNGRQLIAVVLGAPNPRSRMVMAAALFDRGFARIDQPSKSLADLAAQTAMNSPAAAPDMHQSVCGRRGKAVLEYNTDIARAMAPLHTGDAAASEHMDHMALMTTEAVARPLPVAPRITMVPRPSFDPVPVAVGVSPGYAGLVAQARPPHSPIGTAAPPETVSAYAAPEAQPSGEARVPLAPAPDALPMRGRAAHAHSAAKHAEAHHRGRGHDKMVAARVEKHGARKAAKTGHVKATTTKVAAKPKTDEHKKLVAKQHPPAKSVVHSEKAKGKKPEKQAKKSA